MEDLFDIRAVMHTQQCFTFSIIITAKFTWFKLELREKLGWRTACVTASCSTVFKGFFLPLTLLELEQKNHYSSLHEASLWFYLDKTIPYRDGWETMDHLIDKQGAIENACFYPTGSVARQFSIVDTTMLRISNDAIQVKLKLNSFWKG